jgi:epoxyqueuosine reductase
MKAFIKDRVRKAGFSAVGVASAEPVDAQAYLESAIDRGRVAGMGWLARDPVARCDPRSLLPGARSVICCALGYGDDGIGVRKRGEQDRARFARGAEYHDEVLRRLTMVWEAVRGRVPDARAKLCCDTSPVLEKALAQRAGLGWIGKHTVLVNRTLGSWFVLGEIITDIELEPDTPHEDLCGDCTKCLDACPTGAILSPRELDARRCISYLTIEHKGELPCGMQRFISEGTYGCDLCQEACPYNIAK